MEQKNTIYIGAALLLVLLVFFALTNDSCGKRNFSWRETYDETSKEPYGAYVFYELLKNTRSEDDFQNLTDSLYKQLSADSISAEKSTYVFVGAAMYMDSMSVEALLSYVEKGNDAFISGKTIPFELMSRVHSTCNDVFWDDYDLLQDSVSQLNFLHPDIRRDSNFHFKYYKRFSPATYNWNYIDPNIFCDEEYSMVQLGEMNDFYPNFARSTYGKGNFYLHTTPIAFSNFSLQKEENLAYTQKVLAHLDTKKIYYDTYNRVSEGVGRRRNREHNFFDERTFNSENELSYILSQPALRWAWYLTLALVLLYLIFRAKRQQRIIPVTQENRNTSLEFVETIGQLYFQKSNHQELAAQKMKLWLGFVREKYRIATKETDANFEMRLAAKSGVPQELIHAILSKDKLIKGATGIQEHTLLDFHQTMERFYQECK